jgi:3-hydroxybutyryl-CoA dehydratase
VPRVGERAELTRAITDEAVRAFAASTGDTNPIHLDEAYAAGTRFGRRIAHGTLVSGIISAVLGTRLPGPGAVYLSQSLQFRAPVFVGDTVTAVVEVIAVRPDKPVVTLRTTCTRGDGAVVLEGEAVLLVPG